jgi:hypothetical protein
MKRDESNLLTSTDRQQVACLFARAARPVGEQRSGGPLAAFLTLYRPPCSKPPPSGSAFCQERA